MDGDTSQLNNHVSTPNCQALHQTLNGFRLSNVLCDVIIVDDVGDTTTAHSCILAAASPVLKSTIMLKDTSKMLIGQRITLMVAGVSVKVWKLLLEYLYLNTLVIPAVSGLLEDIVAASNMLGMKDLTQLIKSHVDSAGIALGPTRDVSSLKITLAPTRPVQTDSKAVQTDVQASEAMALKSEVHVLESGDFHPAAIQQQALHHAPTPVIFQAVTTQQVVQEPLDNSVSVNEALALSHMTKSLRCRFCNMGFDRKANLVEHVSDWCGNLNKPFVPSDIVEKYKPDDPSGSAAFENQGEGKVYRCINPDCGQFFKTSTSLRRHSWECILGADTIRPIEMLHDMADGTIVYKDGADVMALEEGAIQDPLAYLDEKQNPAVMPKARVYNCAHCRFSAKRERMAAHLAVHHGKRRPFSCKVCGLRYGYYDSLRDHYVGVHTTAQFNCTVCGMVFKRSIMLRRHHLYEHTREGKALFPCKGCGKKFKNLAHARRHELYHNPTDARRRFRCDECQKLFCTKQDLERHTDSVHSEVKQYKCPRCPYSTSRKFYLMQHEKKHGVVSGRYICVTCDKCFVNETFFRAHLREKRHQGADIVNASETVQLIQLSAGEAQALDQSQDSAIVYSYAPT